jgi:DNA modification methylase
MLHVFDAGPTVSESGDLWLLGNHCLLCGNSLEEAAFRVLIAGKRAAMVFADPPYNVRIDGNVRSPRGSAGRSIA